MKNKKKNRLLGVLLLTLVFLLAVPLTASAKISISNKPLKLLAGQKWQLGLTGLTGAEQSIRWKVKHKKIATVSQTGELTAKSEGTTKVIAMVDGVKYRCKLTVTQPAISIQLNKTKKSVMKGKRFKLKATLSPTQGSTLPLTTEPGAGQDSALPDNLQVKWKSSNTSVAKVNAKGKVTTVGAGTAQIIAYLEDGSAVEAVCNVTVTLPAIQLSASQLDVTVGTKKSLSIVSDMGSATYKWSSSDKSVAKITKAGKVKGKKAGVAVITVRRVEDGKSASCSVTVIPKNVAQTTAPAQPSAHAIQLLAIMQKYSNQVKADKAAGVRWIYSNSAQATWQEACNEARKKKVTHMNCALGCRWALRELGLLDVNNNFWGVLGGGVEFRSTSKEQLLENCVILPVYKTPDELLAEGNLLPGDICTYVTYGHTNVYAGDGLWYECGRCGLNGKYEDGKYVFDSFGPVASIAMSSTRIGTIIRIVK